MEPSGRFLDLLEGDALPSPSEVPSVSTETVPAEARPADETTEPEPEPEPEPLDLAQTMKRDWDQRASEDHQFFIASGSASSDEEFRRSGEQELIDLILDGITLSPDSAALEIGCGVGRLLAPLSERVAEAYGIDISEVMVEKSREFLREFPRAKTWVTDGTLSPVPDSSIDFVFSYIVFQHIPSEEPIRAYVRETSRVLRPGGIFRFQVDGRGASPWGQEAGTYDGRKFTPAEARALFDETDLQFVDQWGEGTHYHWLTARKKADGHLNPRVRLTLRCHDANVLLDLLERLGIPGASRVAGQVVRGELPLRDALGDLATFVAAEEPLAPPVPVEVQQEEELSLQTGSPQGEMEGAGGPAEPGEIEAAVSPELKPEPEPESELEPSPAAETAQASESPQEPVLRSDEEFLSTVYRVFTGKVPEPSVLEFQKSVLEKRMETRETLLEAVLAGVEFRNLVKPLRTGIPWYIAEGAHLAFGFDWDVREELFPPDLAAGLDAILDVEEGPGPFSSAFAALVGHPPDEEAVNHYFRASWAGLNVRYLALRRLLEDLCLGSEEIRVESGRAGVFLQRLGMAATKASPARGETFAGEAAAAHVLLDRTRDLDTESFVKTCYRLVLGREADEEGAAYWGSKVESGAVNRPRFLKELLRSKEFTGTENAQGV